jgi:hypothetical protein
LTRIYTLQDVIGQLNLDSGAFIDTNPDEPVNQFMQAAERLKVVPTSWSSNVWTPYSWMVANADGPTGFWLLNELTGATTAFDSNPYSTKFHGSYTGTLVFQRPFMPFNALPNPGFETQPATSSWSNASVGTGTSNTGSTTSPYAGTYNLRQTNPSTGNYGGAFSVQGIPVVAGQVLTVNAIAKGNAAATTGPFRITFANPGSIISNAGVASAQPSAQAGVTVNDANVGLLTSYNTFYRTVTVPAGYTWAFVELYASGNGTASTVDWDNISVAYGANASDVYFDGSTGYMDAGSSVNMFDPSGTKSFTIEAWIGPRSIDATFRAICGMEATINHGAFLYWQNGVGFGVGRGDSSAGVDGCAGGTPSLTAVSHVVGTYDGTNLRLYVNGTLVNTLASSRSVDTATATFRVGGTQARVNGNADISLVAVYPNALTAAAILNHYSWGTALTASADYTYTNGSPSKYGWFTYPNPPARGSNRWGYAIWGNAGFTWG